MNVENIYIFLSNPKKLLSRKNVDIYSKYEPFLGVYCYSDKWGHSDWNKNRNKTGGKLDKFSYTIN